MYRAAEKGTKKIITANRLIDGVVVFLGAGNEWIRDAASAAVFGDGAELDAALAFGEEQVAARQILDPYAVDVTIEDGKPVPSRMRERIRAVGPSVAYGEDERRQLADAK